MACRERRKEDDKHDVGSEVGVVAVQLEAALVASALGHGVVGPRTGMSFGRRVGVFSWRDVSSSARSKQAVLTRDVGDVDEVDERSVQIQARRSLNPQPTGGTAPFLTRVWAMPCQEIRSDSPPSLGPNLMAEPPRRAPRSAWWMDTGPPPHAPTQHTPPAGGGNRIRVSPCWRRRRIRCCPEQMSTHRSVFAMRPCGPGFLGGDIRVWLSPVADVANPTLGEGCDCLRNTRKTTSRSRRFGLRHHRGRSSPEAQHRRPRIARPLAIPAVLMKVTCEMNVCFIKAQISNWAMSILYLTRSSNSSSDQQPSQTSQFGSWCSKQKGRSHDGGLPKHPFRGIAD